MIWTFYECYLTKALELKRISSISNRHMLATRKEDVSPLKSEQIKYDNNSNPCTSFLYRVFHLDSTPFIPHVEQHKDKHNVLGPETDFDETYPKISTEMRKNFDKHFGPPTWLFLDGGAKMCLFLTLFLIFLPNAVKKYRVFLDKFYRIEETPNIFFKNFQPFFADFWRFENFERSCCKKISKLQPPFFFIKCVI